MRRPKAVEYAELAGDAETAIDYGAGDEGAIKAITAKANAEVKRRAEAGEEISFSEAVALVAKTEGR